MLLDFSPVSIFALIAIGIEYIIMLDVCTNAYIIAPHEYANIALGYKCDPTKSDGNVKFVQGSNPLPPLTAVDVPFFYHCDPKYDPDAGARLDQLILIIRKSSIILMVICKKLLHIVLISMVNWWGLMLRVLAVLVFQVMPQMI